MSEKNVIGRRAVMKKAAVTGTAILGFAGSSAAPAAAGTVDDPDYTVNKADDYQWTHGGTGCQQADNSVAYNLGFASINSAAGGTGCNDQDQWEHRMVLYGLGMGARDPDDYDTSAANYIVEHTCEAQASSADTQCGEYTIDTADEMGFGIPAHQVNDWVDEFHYGEDQSRPDDYAESKNRLDTWADDYDEIERSSFEHWDSVTAFASLGIGVAGMVSSSVAWPILGLSLAGASFLETLEDDADQYVAKDLDGGDGFRTHMETSDNGWGLAGHYHDFEVTVPAGESMDIDVWHDIGFRDEDACGNHVDSQLDSDHSYTIHVPANAANDSDPDTPYVTFGR